MKQLLPFALVLVLLSSGCTVPFLNIEIPGLPDIPGFGFGPTVVQYEHDILVIEGLQAVPAEIDAGQTTKIIAHVKNIGDRVLDDSDGPIEIEMYDYCEGLFRISQVKCSTGTSDLDGSKCKIKKMLQEETVRVEWTLEQYDTKPVKLRTVCPPDGIKVSVKYPYTTSSLTTVSFISEAELERTVEERAVKSTDSYIVAGQGPIKPYITVEDKQPIPVYTDARTMLQLKIQNLGTGHLNSQDTVGGQKVIFISGKDIAVSGIESGGDLSPIRGECEFATSGWDDKVRLIGKESANYMCRIDLSKLDGKVTKTATRHVEASVKYEYIFTKSVQVVVNPKFVG